MIMDESEVDMKFLFWVCLVLYFSLTEKVKDVIKEKPYQLIFGLLFVIILFFVSSMGYKIASGIIALFLFACFFTADKSQAIAEKNINDEIQFFKEQNFFIDEKIEICKPDVGVDLFFLIDKQNKYFGIYTKTQNKDYYNYELNKFSFDELIDYEISENSTSKYSINALTTIAGTLCFGLVGGIAGAAFGGLKEKQTDKELYINIRLENKVHPYIVLALLTKNRFNNEEVIKYAYERGEKLKFLLEYIRANKN